MYYKLEKDNVYASCLSDEKPGDDWVELNDDLLDIGFDGGYRYKTFMATEQYANEKRLYNDIPNEIQELKMYLFETDYVVTKLAELKIELDETEYEAELENYTETLNKRKQARADINTLEEEQKALEKALNAD